MEKIFGQPDKKLIAALMMVLEGIVLFGLFDFDIRYGWAVLIIAYVLFRGMAVQMKKQQPYIVFSLCSLMAWASSFYLFREAAYVEGISYWQWLTHWGSTSVSDSFFEIGTYIILSYIIFVLIYAVEIWQLMKANSLKWLPTVGCIIFGIVLNIFVEPDYNHIVKTSSFLIGMGLLGLYTVYRLARDSGEKVHYHINYQYYLPVYFIAFLLIWSMGNHLSDRQELPGTRWLHQVMNVFGGRTKLTERIPYETQLTSEVPRSEAVLFEVQASEPLYLRNMAYNEYHDGVWSIGSENEYDAYIAFKPQYLEAEYEQVDAMINEIMWLNSQGKGSFPKYVWLANYEKSVVTERIYKVFQNPINKINYLTVNGVRRIEDEDADEIYYYHSVNNDYFYSDHLVEPSNYLVRYYSHVPKVGSREYVFLHNMNGEKWEELYNSMNSFKDKHALTYKEKPKLLLTYTQMVQYKNAKYSFMQVPKELEQQLAQFANEIIGEEQSDWGRAQALSDYLRNNYAYSTQEKKSEGEPVTAFLFENKEGICQDFATSMTLMCRSIGIPAKYVTGYLAQEKDSETGNYVVKEKDAHAFVEVYIAGYGWMTFDPTPPQPESMEQETQTAGSNNNIWIAAAIIAALFVISGTGRAYIQKKWWHIQYILSAPEEKLHQLTKAYLSLLKSKGMEKLRHETLSQYAARLQKEQIDIWPLVKLYEAQKYGLEKPDEKALEAAQACYQKLKEQLQKKPFKNKKK